LLFKRRSGLPDAISGRPMSCTFEAGPLPQELDPPDGLPCLEATCSTSGLRKGAAETLPANALD